MAWDKSPAKCLKELKTSEEGLSEEEVKKRIERYGYNEIEKKKRVSPIALFLSQFNNPLVLILIGAALISAFLSYSQGKEEYFDAILIFAIILGNAIFGFVQEYKAERTMEMLAQLAAPKATVLRGGKEQEVAAREVVPGDILIIREGDRVAADARLLESISLYADESMLTGESTPVEKDAKVILKKRCPLAERKNMLFMGTVITRGKGKAVVVSTGMNTEMGKIAGEIIEAEDGKTKFQEEMERLSKRILIGVLIILAIISGVELFIKQSDFLAVFMAAVALGVAAIPEGLPAVITLSLSIATNRMLAQNVLMRKLVVIQNLGSVDVICTDKTGTLTENRMTVVEIRTEKGIYEVSGRGYEKKGEIKLKEGEEEDLEMLLRAAVLCNDAKTTLKGDPTEVALLLPAYKYGMNVKEVRKRWKRIDEIPFSSERKMMSTVNSDGKEEWVFVKGAPEVVLPRCGKEEMLKSAEEMAKKALRVIAVAYRKKPKRKENYEKNLRFLGLMGMIDPPRKGVKEALEECRGAGIRVIMITGDHPQTAKAIGKELGFKGKVITGEQLDRLEKKGLEKVIEEVDIYARTSPHHKTLLLKALKGKGHVVCMTGDGVNDAPAVKHADVGISMGIRGTEVTKQASDMVVLDDNFISIKNAIKEGRGAFDNIRKFVVLLLGANLSEVLAVFLASFSPLSLSPKIPIQLLWINLLTDGLPALALGAERPAKDIMKRKPRKAGEGVLTKENIAFILLMGVTETLAVMYLYYTATTPQEAYSMFFSALVIYEILSVYMIKWKFNSPLLSNKWVHLAVGTAFIMQMTITYTDASTLFGIEPLSLNQWVRLASAGLVFVGVLVLGEKALKRFI